MNRKQPIITRILFVLAGFTMLVGGMLAGCASHQPSAGFNGMGLAPENTPWYMPGLANVYAPPGDAPNHAPAGYAPDRPIGEADIRQAISQVRAYESSEHYYRRGRYLQDRHKHRIAIQEFKSVLARDPGNADALNAMGISYDFLGEHSKAIQVYREALDIDPDRCDILNNMGYSLLLRGDVEAAIIYLGQAVASGEPDNRYRYNLGLAYAENGNLDAALREFENTGDTAHQAHTRLARILHLNGHEKAAEEQVQLAGADTRDDKWPMDEILFRPRPTIPVTFEKEEDEPGTASGEEQAVTSADRVVHE